MRRLLIAFCVLLAVIAVPVLVSAVPLTGCYRSTDMSTNPLCPTNQLLTGRGSTWRPLINSGFPHVLHLQSWNGTNLGTQWDISCPIEPTNYVSVQDNRVGGNGTIVYISQYKGGTFTFLPGGWPWGDGTGTLVITDMQTIVQYQMIGGVSQPVASVVNGTAHGMFVGGCSLAFAIANGSGVGETSSLYPLLTKPATYPTFLDGTCGSAPPNQQFGTWGDVITITMGIDCATPASNETWGRIKVLYR